MSNPQEKNELMQAGNNMSVDEYLAQLHADYDPVYTALALRVGASGLW